VADITESEHLLHGDETEAYADAGYTGVAKRPEFQGSDVVWHVAEKRGKLKTMEEGPRKTLTAQRERVKAQVRAKIELLDADRENRSFLRPNLVGLQLVAASR